MNSLWFSMFAFIGGSRIVGGGWVGKKHEMWGATVIFLWQFLTGTGEGHGLPAPPPSGSAPGLIISYSHGDVNFVNDRNSPTLDQLMIPAQKNELNVEADLTG